MVAARNVGGKSRAQKAESGTSEPPESAVKPLLKKPANPRPKKEPKPETALKPQKPAAALKPQKPAAAPKPQKPAAALKPQRPAAAPKPQRPAAALKPQKPATALKADSRKAKPQKVAAAPRKASERPGAAKVAPASANGKRSLRPKPPADDRLGPEGERLVAALQRHPAPWATRLQLGLEEKRADPVVKRLIAAGRIVSVGKLDASEAYALAPSNDAAESLEELAARTLADLTRPGKLDLLPLAETDERYRGIPEGVRGAIVARLTRQVSQCDAFPVQVGDASFVALAEGLRALVGAGPQKAKGAGVPRSRRASP